MASRRTNSSRWTASVLFVVGVAVAAVSIAVLAERVSVRIDATMRQTHRLSPRAEAVLGAADDPIEIIAAIDGSARDGRLIDAAEDVLEAFGGASDNISLTTINTARPLDRDRFDRLVEAMVARDRDRYDAIARTLSDVATEMRTAGATLADAAAAVDSAEPAAVLRTLARDLDVIARRVEQDIASWSEMVAPDPKPTLDTASQAMEALASQLATLATADDASVSFSARRRGIPPEVGRVRDRALAFAQRLKEIKPPDATRLAGAVASNEAIIISRPTATDDGRPTLVGIDPTSLFPSGLSDAGSAITQTRLATERALVAGIGAVTRLDRPIVVLGHAEWTKIAGLNGIASLLADRLRASGIDLVDWAIARGDPPPALAKLDPTGQRPVVYLILTGNSWQPPVRRDSLEIPSGLERTRRVASAVSELISDDRPLLVCLQPSDAPSYGSEDPIARSLAPLGVRIDSGRPLLSGRATPGGVVADPMSRVTQGDELGHPIARATRGLQIGIEWALPIEPVEIESVSPLVRVPADANAWAESRWLAYMRTPLDQRRLVAQPVEDEGDDGDGPWVVAAACEPAGGPRAVVVGGATWFLDPVWAAGSESNPDRFAQPGNIELLEACIAWLAGQDELIAASGSARATPTIGPMSDGLVSGLRWGLMAGLPALILVFGVLYRMIRG